jgi:hypothetical protein
VLARVVRDDLHSSGSSLWVRDVAA